MDCELYQYAAAVGVVAEGVVTTAVVDVVVVASWGGPNNDDNDHDENKFITVDVASGGSICGLGG